MDCCFGFLKTSTSEQKLVDKEFWLWFDNVHTKQYSVYNPGMKAEGGFKRLMLDEIG